MKYRIIKECNISGSRNLKMILSLGLIPPVNQMSKITERPKEQFFFPTEIYYCPESKLVQLRRKRSRLSIRIALRRNISRRLEKYKIHRNRLPQGSQHLLT